MVAEKEPEPLELRCPVLCAWFDCTSSEAASGTQRRVRLEDASHCEAAGASFACSIDSRSGALEADVAQLRTRSAAAQDGDCGSLQRGVRVLALQRCGGGSGAATLWRDATLLSAARFPHLPDGCCQCLFTVRWLGGLAASGCEELMLDRLCLRPAAEQRCADGAAEDGPPPPPSPPSSVAAPPAELLVAAPLLGCARSRSAVLSFFHWCSLREEAQCARRAGRAPPWAAHPLLAGAHFCNVSRLEDRGTLAFHALLRAQRVRSLAGVLWCSLLYRRLNRLGTFVEWGRRLPLPQDAAAWLAWLAARAGDGGGPLFTAKHQQSGGLEGYLDMVRGLAGLPGADGAAPDPRFPPIAQLATALQRCACARDAHRTLKAAVRHVGDFIAWQVLCDCVEAGALAAAAADDWAALGPGARAGLELLAGAGEGGEAALLGRLRQLQAAQPWALAQLGRPSFGCVAAGEGAPPLLLRDLEHSLCEFSKWLALRRGGASPGAYQPAGAGADGAPRPLPPPLRLRRLAGGRFQVLPSEEEEGAAEEGLPCAAFPNGVAVLLLPDGTEEPPPWMPLGGPKRAREAGPRRAAGPKVARVKPERAAMLAWWADWWPAAQAQGWRTVTKTREAGASSGTSDTYFIAPAGRRFRSRTEVAAWTGGVGVAPAVGPEAAPADEVVLATSLTAPEGGKCPG